MGARGAVLKAAGETYTHAGHAAIVADTVGAGDAFLAGFMKAWADNEPFPVMLERACVLGAFVASAVGACPDYTYIDGIPSIDHQSIFSHK
jgi:fructokinase